MAQLLIRGLDKSVVDRLKQRARAHGHSLESEVRAILYEAVGLPPPKEGPPTLTQNRGESSGS